MNQEMKEALSDLTKLSEFMSAQTPVVKVEAFNGAVSKLVEEKYLASYVESLLKGEDTKTKPKNLELFREMQDLSVNHYSDITKESLNVAVAAYIEKGGEFDEVEIPQIPILFKELYGLDDKDDLAKNEAKLSTAARDALPAGAFCGPNRSFPVHDKAHAIAAMRLLGRYKGGDKATIRACIARKAKQYGVGTSDKNGKESFTFYPLIIDIEKSEDSYTPLSISSKEDLDSINKNVDNIVSSYQLSSEQKQQLLDFIKEAEANLPLFDENCDPLLEYNESEAKPITLDESFLLQYFINNESNGDSRKYILPLVGLVRTNKITKEAIESASSKYDVFGLSVLKVLLQKGIDENIDPDTSEKITTMQPVPAAEVTESTEEQPLKISKDLYSFVTGKKWKR